MAKTKINYVCTQCGAVQPKWMGKCPDCGSWNTLVEQVDQPVSRFASAPAAQAVSCAVQTLEQIDSTEEQRYLTRMQELNRVLGGGIVPGSVILLSGDPGIGKSTLLLQICQSMDGGQQAAPQILYVSGEESLRQIKLRA
ncbi:MAG: AAA family ATPase, partial [Negativibacillus sp.]